MSSIGDLFNHFMNLVGLNYYNKSESDTKYATKTHTHNEYLISHQDISGKLDKAQGSTNKNKNVVTDNSGNITVEAKPTIPSKTSDLTNDGDGTNAFVKTNDPRLSDARTPIFNQIVATSSNIQDLNNYKTGGFYYCSSDATHAPYIIHCPWSNGTATPYTGNKSFFLLVETWGTTSNYVKQTLTYYNSNQTFVRTCSNSNWTTWKELNTNSYDALRVCTRIITGEAIPANNIIGGGIDSKYYQIKANRVLDVRYPILYNISAITSGSYTDNVYVSYTGAPLTNNVSGITVTNQKQVYIEGTSYDGRQFTVSNRVFVSDDQISPTTDLGKYYIYIGASYSTTNIRFNSFNPVVYIESRNGLVPLSDNNLNPHTLVKSDAGTVGYFKFLTIRTTGTYHDHTIEFDVTHRSATKTVCSFSFQTYSKTSGSTDYYIKIPNFYYHGYPTPIYYVQTNDGIRDATFDFYIKRESWDEMAVSDLNTSFNNYNGMTVTWKNEFTETLPSGTTQASLNPYYASVNHARTDTDYGGATASNYGHVKLSDNYTSSAGTASQSIGASSKAVYDTYYEFSNSSKTTKNGHVHGSLTSGGALNSDITSVNKVAVTDSSNNLKTISQLPYSKISGTPTIPTADNSSLQLSNNQFSIKSGGVTSSHIADKTIVNGDIADTTIETGKIKDSAITSAKIADGTIVNGDIANTTITGGKLVNGTVTATQLASNSVETAKIKDGNVTSAKLADPSNIVTEYITGTHGTTATSTWTGTSTKINSLQTGQVIYFKMTSAGTSTAVTLNLTLANGTTTGAKNVRYNSSTNLTTHFPQNTVLELVYDGTYWVCTAIQNTNNYDRMANAGQVVGGEAIAVYTLIYGKSDGKYYKIASNGALDTRYPVLWLGTALASGGTVTNLYSNYPSVNIQNTVSGKTLTASQMCYLEGTLNKGIFTISSNVFVTSLTDGKHYIPLGFMTSTTNLRFNNFDKVVYKYSTANGLVPVGYSYNDLLDKPSSFPPSSHTHSYLPSNANGTTTGTLTATKFINSSSNNTNILLGNGNTLAQSTFATSSHTHDDRYYTETEINTKLNGKADSTHSHATSQVTQTWDEGILGNIFPTLVDTAISSVSQEAVNTSINGFIGKVSKWELMQTHSTTNKEIRIWRNEGLGLCKLYVKYVGTLNANTNLDIAVEGWINENIRPLHTTVGSVNYTGAVTAYNNGRIVMRIPINVTNSSTFYATAIWMC